MKKFLIFLNLGLLILDRFSKWFILNRPDFYSGDLIELKLFKNPNIYFISLYPHTNILVVRVIGTVILLFLFLFFKSWQKRDSLLMMSFSLIILGGLSNFFDRIYFGYVVDWIRVFFLPISIFNIADIMIISGILCLIFRLTKSR